MRNTYEVNRGREVRERNGGKIRDYLHGGGKPTKTLSHQIYASNTYSYIQDITQSFGGYLPCLPTHHSVLHCLTLTTQDYLLADVCWWEME